MALQRFLVTAATGTVGRPLTLKLLAMGHQVHALTNNPESDRAQEIARAGAKLFQTTLDNKAGIAAAAASCTGVYLNPMPADISKHFSEATYADNVITAAREAGVRTCVYQSVEGTDIITSIPEWNEWIANAGVVTEYWKMKTSIQRAVEQAGFDSWSAVQGSIHMSNFTQRYITMMFPGLRDTPTGALVFPVREETRLHLVDPTDLAELAAQALTNPDRFNGKAFNAVGQVLTLSQIATVVGRHAGKPVQASHPDQETVKAQRESNLAFGNGLVLDIFADRTRHDFCQSLGIEYNTLDNYLSDRQDELVQAIA